MYVLVNFCDRRSYMLIVLDINLYRHLPNISLGSEPSYFRSLNYKHVKIIFILLPIKRRNILL